MATDRNVGLVAVGVDATVALPKLGGAASGALKIAQWLRAQSIFGVTSFVRELTDATGVKVSARDVQDGVRELVERGDLDLLILYFAGHGIVKSGNDEQILLSEVQAHKDEAIAIAPTIVNAFYSTVPHVIIISDACRNAVDPYGSLGEVAGKPALYRGAVAGARKSKVDVLYATEPSQTAKEFEGEGFFTEVLLDALNNPPAEVCDVWAGLDPGVAVIPTWNLEKYLGVEVPLRAAKQTPSFDQTPDFYVTSREPQFLGYAKAVPTTPSGAARGDSRSFGPVDPIDADRQATALAVQQRNTALADVAAVLTSFAHNPKKATADMSTDAGLAHRVDAYVGSERGRQAFETRTGYSVLGGKVEKVSLSGGHTGELVKTDEGTPSTDVRLYPPPFSQPPHEQRGSVALFFKGGTMCILPILPGYIGTLHVKDGRVVSLAFEVSAQIRQLLNESAEEVKEFSARRALAAALSSSGKLQRLAQKEGSSFASFLRQSKRADPTLGIYASYAYALSGNDGGARSVFDWFQHYPSLDPKAGLAPAPVPFDVAMLADRLSPGDDTDSPGVAPFCPMMTLGWSVLPSYLESDVLHEAVTAAGKHRLNAEWTTFRSKDVRPMLKAFESGDLK